MPSRLHPPMGLLAIRSSSRLGYLFQSGEVHRLKLHPWSHIKWFLSGGLSHRADRRGGFLHKAFIRTDERRQQPQLNLTSPGKSFACEGHRKGSTAHLPKSIPFQARTASFKRYEKAELLLHSLHPLGARTPLKAMNYLSQTNSNQCQECSRSKCHCSLCQLRAVEALPGHGCRPRDADRNHFGIHTYKHCIQPSCSPNQSRNASTF